MEIKYACDTISSVIEQCRINQGYRTFLERYYVNNDFDYVLNYREVVPFSVKILEDKGDIIPQHNPQIAVDFGSGNLSGSLVEHGFVDYALGNIKLKFKEEFKSEYIYIQYTAFVGE